ncbi:MAG: lysophospholipid acyltransferase family protein [Candidatus Wallbacteria bacterium]|nr:lysophospholipid acyltransferase family protein [Candidatus Wallbacteria bacterium]
MTLEKFLLRFGRGMGRLLSCTPMFLHRPLAVFLVGIGIFCNPKRFFLSAANVKRVFPDLSKPGVLRCVFLSYLNLSYVLLEFLQIPWLSEHRLSGCIETTGMEYFDQALSCGRGVILLTAHFGNWEFMGQFLALHGYPLSSLVKTQKHLLLDREINCLRAMHGMEIINKGFGLREAVKTLERNRILGLLLDQDAKDQGIMSPFLGIPASTAVSLAKLHQRFGSPVVPSFITRRGYFRFLIQAGPMLDMTHCGEQEIVDECNRIISQKIMEHPEQWLWLHNRWRTVKS